MWYIVLSVMLYVGLFIYILKKDYDDSDNKIAWSVVHGLLTPFILGLLFMPVVKWTTGMFPDYSDGERIGYFTKISKKGVVFKTWESQIQVGTGEMAALQRPHPLSTVDPGLAEDIQRNLGRKARVRYKEWLIMPYSLGDSGYTIRSIEWLGPEPEGKNDVHAAP